jgi:5-formyltetrahydrofolate cyclo-ligase
MDKPAIRQRVLAARATRSVAELSAAARGLAAQLPEWGALERVAAYVSVGAEPPTEPLLEAWHDAGVEVWLPVVEGSDLRWATYAGAAALAAGPLGLRQPRGPRRSSDVLAGLDLVLVPALAVDVRGHRLGRGAGFYDRAVAGVGAPTFAVVFDDEVLDEVPVEAHDVAVTGWLTPTTIGRSGQ